MAKKVSLTDSLKQHLGGWYPDRLLEDTPVLKGSFFGVLFGLFGQHAVTINKTVHVTTRAPDLDSDTGIVLVGHELFHVIQQQEMGWWGFLARYVWNWRPSHVTAGCKHPLEEPAYARGTKIKQSLSR